PVGRVSAVNVCVPVESEDGSVLCDPGCLVLDSDFLLSGELEFGDAEIMGLDRDSGQWHANLKDRSVVSGVGLDLGAELYCLTCEKGLQREASPQAEGSAEADGKEGEEDAPPRAFSCSLCAFTSRYSNHLKRHMRTHDGHKPHRCPACPYASAQLVNLQRHARTHTGEKPYRCPQCSYACSSLGNLRRHQRMHAGALHLVISTAQNYTQQRGAASENKKEKPVSHFKAEDLRRRREGRSLITQCVLTVVLMCPLVENKCFSPPPSVVSDLTLRVSQDSGYFQTLGGLGSPSAPLPVLLFPLCCRMCGLTLEEDDLEGDKGEGDGETGQVRSLALYRCPHCPFLSHYPNHLARHAHTHSEEKPHSCPHCPYTSSHLDNLKRHLRVHTGEKPYQCPSCSYACGNLANLRRHERIHSGAKPFHCGVCGYSCNQSMNLKRHMLRHTGEKPYACAECDYTTGHWDNYKRHQRKHGHDTDSWDKHAPINGLSWSRDAQGGASEEHG
uniref:C2H2-type domain-containing protein n=1 Tax=Gasterosteus aculeatus aculeatus TaxID=481459 RepID=G3PSA1_GASAC